MVAINEQLSRRYGTGELVKESSFPLAVKLALAILAGKLAKDLSGHDGVERGRQETELALAQEAERMGPVDEGFRQHAGAEKLARMSGSLMAKSGGMVGKALGVGAIGAGMYGTSKAFGAVTNYRRGPRPPSLYGTGHSSPMRQGITEFGQ
jgi:hypothetical protein